MTRWRQGGKIPHHVYEQRGDAPDRRPWPDGDPPILVVPRMHVRDAAESPTITALTMARAAELAVDYTASNILTSNGAAASQSVFHLHIHLIPRSEGDQLMVPWGTTGNPHEPHRCKGMDRLEARLAELEKSRVGPLTISRTVWTGAPPDDPPVRYIPVPVEGPMRTGRRRA